MTKEELFGLPPAMALRLIFAELPPDLQECILGQEKPKLPFSPKYDMKIYRKDGFQWASETALDGLQYWHQKATQSAASGGQYAEKDKKKADNLQRWIAWRECFPDAAWSGERDHDAVTAPTPSSKPMVYAHSARAAASSASAPSSDHDNDDSIPF